MPRKTAEYSVAEFKAAPEDGTLGEFSALVSVFGNVDTQGDRVMPGAFKNSLAQWKSSGNPIPVIWSHDWKNAKSIIGSVTDAEETPQGLQVAGKLNVKSNDEAAYIHDLLLTRTVTGMSFAYEVINEKLAKDGANELTELRLIEVGPTLQGANAAAQLIAAKAEKAGARLSQATQTEMQAIHDDITAVQVRMRGLMGTASEEPKNSEDVESADTAAPTLDTIEADNEPDDDREPQAKSSDDDVLRFVTRIEEMRATRST